MPDRLSDILAKGEFAPRYYNPCDVFDDLHLVTTTDDRPDVAALQRTAGRARLHVHSLPFGAGRTERWLRWAPPVLERWAKAGVALAQRIRPQLVRCYGLDANAYLAARIHETLGTPFIVSVHTARDESPEPVSAGARAVRALFERVERRALRAAARVLPVYEGILPQLERQGASRVEVAYNVINPDHLVVKTNYQLHRPVRILNVGRQLAHKTPAPIVDAVASIPDAHLTVVGDGPIHDSLRALVRERGLDSRVVFRQSVPNDELCASLPEFDFFAAHSEYCEIPKAVLEPLIAGLPVVMNRRHGLQVPELRGDHVVLVEGNAASYRTAFEQLIRDDRFRETTGRRARAVSESRWEPRTAESRMASIYRTVMAEAT